MKLAGQVTDLSLSRKQHGEPRRGLLGKADLELVEAGSDARPVIVHGLVKDVEARVALGELVRAGAGRLIEAIFAFLIPLRLADDFQIAGAGEAVFREPPGHRALEVEHDRVVVGCLDTFNEAPGVPERCDGILAYQQGMGVLHILGGELSHNRDGTATSSRSLNVQVLKSSL